MVKKTTNVIMDNHFCDVTNPQQTEQKVNSVTTVYRRNADVCAIMSLSKQTPNQGQIDISSHFLSLCCNHLARSLNEYVML